MFKNIVCFNNIFFSYFFTFLWTISIVAYVLESILLILKELKRKISYLFIYFLEKNEIYKLSIDNINV